MPPALMVQFCGGDAGPWRVERIIPVIGQALSMVARVAVLEGAAAPPPRATAWLLRSSTGNMR